MNVNATVNDIINPHRSLGATRPTARPAQTLLQQTTANRTDAPRTAPPTATPTIVAREIPLQDITVPAPTNEPSAAQGQGGLTVEGLKGAWGQANSAYDLNADGTVNFADMLKLLGMLGESGGTSVPIDPTRPAPVPDLTTADPNTTSGPFGPTDPDAAPAAVDLSETAPDTGTVADPPTEPEPITIESLLEAWGQQGTRFDLNGDGTVNFGDVLQLLATLGNRNEVTPPVEPGAPGAPNLDAAQPELAAADPDATPLAGTPNLTDAAPDTTNEQPITIDELIAAWGKRDERLDINADGEVNFGDILELLARQGNRAGEAPNAATAGAGELDPRTIAQRVQPIAESLLEQLEARGFDQHPPLNIHQVVAQFGLGADAEQTLLDQLSQRYPSGLGVNLTA